MWIDETGHMLHKEEHSIRSDILIPYLALSRCLING